MSRKGFSYNGVRNSNIYLLEGRKKAPFFPINRTIVKAGSCFRIKKTDKGLLDISQPIGFVVKNDNDALALKDELSAWLVTEGWATLQFDDEPGRTYQAVVQNTIDDFEKFVEFRQGTIQFIACAEEGQTHNLTMQTDLAKHAITGQEKTPWKIRTVFEVPQEKFTLEASNGLYILLNYNFIAGDVLEIDYLSRSATLNGKNIDTAISIKSVFKELEPGQMEFVASHKSTVTYTERYY